MGRQGSVGPLRTSHFAAQDCSFMKPFQRDVPNLISFPTPQVLLPVPALAGGGRG